MFNLDRIRTMNFDNLQGWRIYTLNEEAVTAAGWTCPAGAEFWFEFALVNLTERTAAVHGSTPDGEELVFHTRGDGHRHLFAYTGREWRPRSKAQPSAGGAVEAGQEAAWLAARPEFARVAAIAAGAARANHWGAARADADELYHAAISLEKTAPGVARWLADLSLGRYHEWMSQATSGGEGTAMQSEVRGHLEKLRGLLRDGDAS
ncbi:MAG: hypothetical protein R2762_24895 [Bryobacteraceae bacterium]